MGINYGPNAAELTASTFSSISEIAYEVAGLYLPSSKHSMVAARIARRMTRLAVNSFDEYVELISDPNAPERRRMIAALTTNVSQFFREPHHFEVFRSKLLPPLIQAARSGARLRIWSAGCANGQEAYSLSITLLDCMPDATDYDIRILGTDIDPSVIRFAQLGTYHSSMMSGLTDAQKEMYFSFDASSGSFGVKPTLRNLTIFRELNLHGSWPMPGRFDVIMCRNVVIYFDQTKQSELWTRFHDKLNRSGWLFVGHSERLGSDQQDAFRLHGPTLYQRVGRHTP